MTHSPSNPLVSICPVCGEPMSVRVTACNSCESELHGNFHLPPLARLPRELQRVVELFMQCRGSIKELEKQLGISYPTVCRKLDTINTLLDAMTETETWQARVLRRLDTGEISAKEAVEQLKKG